MFKLCNTFQLGAPYRSENAIYSYSSFNWTEQSDAGLFLYFGQPNSSNPFGETKMAVLRFDTANLKWSTRLLVYPTRMLETYSRVYSMHIKFNGSAPNAYNVTIELIPDSTGKNLNILPNPKLITVIEVLPGYSLTSLFDINLQLTINNTLIINGVIRNFNERIFLATRHEIN